MGYNTSFFSVGSGGGGGSTTFTGLTDTPSSYSGQAGKIPTVNPAENGLIFADASGAVTPVDASYENVAAMVAATGLASGNIVQTFGYHTVNDGGQMVYVITNTDLSAQVDGGSVIALAGSLYAQAQFPPYYRPEMWGAKGDNSTASATANATALAAMFNYSRDTKTKPVYFSGGSYYINEAVPFYKPLAGINLATGYYVVYGNGSTIKATGRRTSSSDTLTIQTGSVTLTVASADQRFAVGDRIRVYANSYAYNFMEGTITDYTGTSLTVDVDTTEYFYRRAWNTRVNFALGTQRITYVSANNAFKVGEAIEIRSGSWKEGGLSYSLTATVTGTNNGYLDVDVTDNGGAIITENTLFSPNSISTGVKRFQGIANASRFGGATWVRLEYDASNYVEGYTTFVDSGNSFYVKITVAVGSGTYNAWTCTSLGLRNFEIAQTSLTHNSWTVAGGIKMFDRSLGPEQATSTTSQTIGTGSKTFNYVQTTETFYALANQRTIRIIYDSSNTMSGTVTAWDSTARTVTVNVTSTTGSGTYADWTLDLNMMWLAERAVASKFDIYDLQFQGQGLQGLDTGLHYACSYGSAIRGGLFASCQTGFFGEFNLMATYTDCILFSNEYGARYDKGNWYGASGSNSQSNVANIINYRQLGAAGSKAGVYVKASNSYWFQNFICEGAPSYAGVLFQRFGSPNVTVATFDDVHLEVTCYHAFYEAIDDSGMNIEMNRVYPQYNNIIANTQADFSYNAVWWVGGSAFIARGDNWVFPAPYNAVDSLAINLTEGIDYWANGAVPFYAYGEFGLSGTRLGKAGTSIGMPNYQLNAGSNLTWRVGSNTYLNVSTNGFTIGRSDLGYVQYAGNNGIRLQQIAAGRTIQITQNPTSNAGGIRLEHTIGTAYTNRISIWRQATYGAGFSYEYALPSTGGTDGQVMQLATGSASTLNMVNFKHLLGQCVARVWYRPASATATALTTSFQMEAGSALTFTATGTTMTITGQVYVEAGSGESISLGLSTDDTTFTDAGSTETVVYDNGAGGSHTMSTTLEFDFNVAGLTNGTSYTYYLALKSSSTTSQYFVGGANPALILQAKHAS